MKLYIASVLATHNAGHLSNYPVAVVAEDYDSAKGKVQRIAEAQNPFTDGWKGHITNVNEVPQTTVEFWSNACLTSASTRPGDLAAAKGAPTNSGAQETPGR